MKRSHLPRYLLTFFQVTNPTATAIQEPCNCPEACRSCTRALCALSLLQDFSPPPPCLALTVTLTLNDLHTQDSTPSPPATSSSPSSRWTHAQPPDGPHAPTPAPHPSLHTRPTHPEPVSCASHITDPAATACVTNKTLPLGRGTSPPGRGPTSTVSRLLYVKSLRPQPARDTAWNTLGASTRHPGKRAPLPPPSADRPEDSWSSFKA